MLLEEKGLFKYIIAGLFILPSLAVTDFQSCLLIAPSCFLGLFLAWYRNHRVIIISPEHLVDAIEELESLNDELYIQVYRKSAEDYAKYVDNDFREI